VALKEVELFCTVVSATGTAVFIPTQGPLKIKKSRHHGAAEDHRSTIEAHQVTMEIYHDTVKAHHGAIEAHHGVVV
jgi:hypothetical protein